MKKSISIIKNGMVTNGPLVKPEAEAMAWLNRCLAKGTFGPENTFQVLIEDVVPNYKDVRKIEYEKRIDPLRNEAIMDNFLGKPEKMQALLAEYQRIKKEIPKPVSINDSGDKEWL